MRSRLTISTCLCIALIVFERTLLAQGLHNGSKLYVNGVTIFVDGDVNNSGLLVNGGSVGFTGDWNNEGTYDGDGRIEVSGKAPQVISNNDQGMSTLIIDGWGTKYVDGSLNISRELRLIRGIVEVSSNDILTLESGAAASGGSDESYVDGALAVEGKGYKFFPIGKNGIYAPIELLNVQGPIGRYSMEVFENAPPVSVEGAIVRKSLYWQRTDIIGEFGASRVAIDFERDFFENPNDITLLAGDNFDQPFTAISDLDRSAETDKIITRTPISAPIIMLGEISSQWTDADFYLSTALSPHAFHAENRSVKIFGDRLSDEQFRFQVFDRWGNLIFQSTSLEHMQKTGWDGRVSAGPALSTGTYPYRLSALDKTGKKFERKGIVTIIH